MTNAEQLLKPAAVKFFRQVSKPFSHSILNFINACEINSSETFLGRCKQPKVRGYQIHAAGTVGNNFKSDAPYHC
jgi:hypothetical protein